MINKVDDLPISNPENFTERKWFSFIKHKAEGLNYGSLNLVITVKGGKVCNIKNITKEENFNVNPKN